MPLTKKEIGAIMSMGPDSVDLMTAEDEARTTEQMDEDERYMTEDEVNSLYDCTLSPSEIGTLHKRVAERKKQEPDL